MSRPRKCRRICALPKYNYFIAAENRAGAQTVYLSIDEYETIRLIDYCQLSQNECSTYMQVARTTVQQIYASARYKLAKALQEGASLRIEGGDYVLADPNYCRLHCHRRFCQITEKEVER